MAASWYKLKTLKCGLLGSPPICVANSARSAAPPRPKLQ